MQELVACTRFEEMFRVVRNFNIAIFFWWDFYLVVGDQLTQSRRPHRLQHLPRPLSSPGAYFNLDRPSDDDTFPDTDAVSHTDALSNGYSHTYSMFLRQPVPA
jgi:hypothetical protein